MATVLGNTATDDPILPQTVEKGGGKNGQNSPASAPPDDPHTQIKSMRKRGVPWAIAAGIAAILLLLLVGGFFGNRWMNQGNQASATTATATQTSPERQPEGSIDERIASWPSPSTASALARFPKAAVVSDNGHCSEIGRSVLMRGGNAVDAAIATTVCVGALNVHSSGIGGGFLATLYNPFYGKCTTIDARETAPAATNKDTFAEKRKDAMMGYKSIAVPGELHGYWTAFKRFSSGRIAWQDLVMPTVKLLSDGYPITKQMEINLGFAEERMNHTSNIRSFFTNNATGKFYREGEILKNPQLAETYRKLAVSSDPVRTFYAGEMAKLIAEEMRLNGGYITKRDLEQYRTVVDDEPPTNTHFHPKWAMCGPRPPSGFAITQLIVAVMAKLHPPGKNQPREGPNATFWRDPKLLYTSTDYYHHLIEALKFAYAQRSKLGDARHVPEMGPLVDKLLSAAYVDEIVAKIDDKALGNEGAYGGEGASAVDDMGTSHIAVVDADGNGVALTSSVNYIFGSVTRSPTTGIIWNDHMDDFSLPGVKNYFGYEPAENNFIAPGKRPMSSISPLIVFDKTSKRIKAAVGASGGSKIISALSQVLLHSLLFNQTVKEAIDIPRIHNQYTPMTTSYEKGTPKWLVDELASRGHNMTEMRFPFAVVQAIMRDEADGQLTANSDPRRPIYMYPTGY